MENEYILHNARNSESAFDSVLSESTEIEKKFSDISLQEEKSWWKEIQEVIFPDMKDTTFLKIFFSIPFYLHEIDKKIFKSRHNYSYEDIYSQIKTKLNIESKPKNTNFTYNTLAAEILKNVDTVCTTSEKFGIERDIERAAGNKEKYSNNDIKRFVFKEYRGHSDFYTRFLRYIFNSLSNSIKIKIDVNEKSRKISDEIFNLTNNQINRQADDPIENLSLYFQYFIHLKTNDNNDDILSSEIISKRLRDCNNLDIQQDLLEYAVILEHYPVNTIERFGALEQAASQRNGRRNLYAVSELYFLYQYGTVLSNICGDKRYILKRNTEKANDLYRLLLPESNGFLPVILNHDGLSNEIWEKQKGGLFTPKEIQFYREKYKKYGLEQKKVMIQSLVNLYKHPNGVPLNLDLMFFLEAIKAEQVNPDCVKIVNEVKDDWYKLFTNFNNDESLGITISEEKNNDMPIHKILYTFFEKLPNIDQDNDLLKQLCSQYPTDELKKSMETAKQIQKDYNDKALDDATYDKKAGIWLKIYRFLAGIVNISSKPAK